MIIGWYNKKMGGKILAYCLLICMVFSSFMVMPSPVTAAESWENNGIGLSELVPENVVVFAGNAMDESKMGFLKNFYYLTEDDLDDLRVADNGSKAYKYFGEEAWISDTLYSSSDDHGTPEWRYNCFSGIDLKAAFNGMGVATTSSMSLKVKSTDGTAYTLQDAFDPTRYYFNPQGQQSAGAVTPILALKRSIASTLDAPSPESTLEVPATAADKYAPLFAYGQETANEDNNCHFVKTVNSVVAGTEDVALTVKQDGKNDKQMSISEIIRQGVYKTEYTFKSSGAADYRTHEVTGIPLARLLTAMGVSVAGGQGIQPTTSDNYPTSAIARADMDKWFVAYDAKENGSQVENYTALRLYGPGQFGNQMIVKHLKELTVTGEVTIDKSALNSAISAANAKHDNAAEGTATGQYAAGSKAIFKAAIEDAQEVADDSAATQAEVDQAIIDLAAAEALFDAAKITGGKEEGGDAANAVFYIAVKESADSATKYYYYTRAELEACATTQDYLYNDHSVIKTVTARGALLSALLADLDGVTITDDMIIQYAEADGYHADQNTAIENSSYKDKVSWLTTSHFDSFTKEAARTTITYEIHEEYLSPDENNVNDPPGFFKDADKDSGYLRAYRETGSGQNDANIGGANATVIKYLMGVVVSYNGALFSGKDGYTLKAVSAKNPDLSIIADQKVTGLVPGMEYAVQAPSVVNAVLASGESPYQMITVGTGATQTITFKYTENPYFYVTKGSDTVNYTYTDLVKSSVQMPDKDDNTAPYGYSRPMYYRYNGKWLADLIGTEIMNNSTVTGFKIIAKDGTKTEISKEEVADYFVAYNNTQSKTSTNIPEGKRVTETYEDARIIIPGEGENITGSLSDDYTSAGKDVGVLVAEAEGIVAIVKSSGSPGGGGGGGVVTPTVSSVKIKTAPDKVVYDEGDALKLAGLEITLTYSDETTKDVAYADFAGYDITVSPKNGDLLKAEDAEILIAVNSKTAKQTITVNARKVTAVAPPQAEQAGLKDVSGHWAAASIDEMIEKGIVSGYPDGTFKPEQPITRAEFTVMLAKAFNLPAEGNKVFDDTAGHWAQGFIAAASDAGIVSGISVGEFAPDALITREQMAVMIVNAAKIATSDEELTLIDQNSISAWARNAVASAVSAELIFGYPDQTFRPQDNASRAEAVSVIARALDTRQ